MLSRIPRLRQRFKEWSLRQARGKYAPWVLGLVAFTESSFFPVPVDFLLVPLVIADKRRWFTFGSIAAVASVAGGIAGYLIGLLLFDTIGQWLVEVYHLGEEMNQVQTWYNKTAFWATFVSAFTLIPYKVFTIAGGLFKVPWAVFIAASVLGRGIRFIGEAYLVQKFGEQVGRIMYRHMTVVLVLIAVLAVLLMLLT